MSDLDAGLDDFASRATDPKDAFADAAHTARLQGFDLAVIGAGPAGMAAAATAAEHGLRVALIDAGRQLGGQYFRHPAPGLTAPWLPKLYHGWQHFERLLTRVETASGIEVLFGHQVWSIEPGFRVLTDRGPVEARYVILATGAYERVVPFPGWGLPGVLTAGGAQALLKGNLVLPGRRVVVAGTGPLLLPVAAGLATAGAKVLGLYEANTIRGYAKNPLPLLANPTKLAEGMDYARHLTRARIPLHTGRMIIEAQGTDTLEAVIAAHPDGTNPQRIPCDTLAISYGLAPQIDLALTLGAATKHLPDGTIALHVTTTQRTTIPNLYAAGETAGVAGAETALLEGEIAALAVAQAAARAHRPAPRATAEGKPKKSSPDAAAQTTRLTSEDATDRSLAARALAAARSRISRRTPDAAASSEAGGAGFVAGRARFGPARAGSGPARAGSGPARAGSKPARAGFERGHPGFGPARAGFEPARAGSEPGLTGSEPGPAKTKLAARVLARLARRLSQSPDTSVATSSKPEPAPAAHSSDPGRGLASNVLGRLARRRTSPSPDTDTANAVGLEPVPGGPEPVLSNPKAVPGAPKPVRGGPKAVPSGPKPVRGKPKPVPGGPKAIPSDPKPAVRATARAVAAARSRLPRRISPAASAAADPARRASIPASAASTSAAAANPAPPGSAVLTSAAAGAVAPSSAVSDLVPPDLANLSTLLRRRTRQRAFADLLRARHPIPDAWRRHLAADTLVCRCEEVPASAIAEAITDLGAADARTVKLLTRAGMGWCQGRVCGYAVACLARGSQSEPPTEADLLAAAKRPLARPVPLGVLAEQDRRNT